MAEYVGQLTAFKAENGKVIYKGKGFQLGTYKMANGTTFSLTPEEFDSITLPAFTAKGSVPNELEHYDSVDKNPNILSGKVGNTYAMRREGDDVYVETEIPLWLHKEINDGQEGSKPVGVSLVFANGTKAPAYLGLTLEPRVSDAQLFAAFSASQAATAPNPKPMNPLAFMQAMVAAMFGATSAAETGEPATPPVPPATPPAFSHQSAPPSAVVDTTEHAKTVAENAQLKKTLAEREDADIVAFSQKFADDEFAAFRCYPEEKDLLRDEMADAIRDDNALEVSAFSKGAVVEGARVKRIRARQAARVPINETSKPKPDGDGKHKVFTPGAPNNETTSPERITQLMAMAGPVGADMARERK